MKRPDPQRGPDPKIERAWYASFLFISDEKGWSRGGAYHWHLAKFGKKPPWDWRECVKPIPPSIEQRKKAVSDEGRRTEPAALSPSLRAGDA